MPDQKARLGWMAIAVLFFLVQAAYVLLPADVIPDVIPVLGWLDDLVVSLISLSAAAAAGSYAMRKGPEEDRDQIEAQDTPVAGASEDAS